MVTVKSNITLLILFVIVCGISFKGITDHLQWQILVFKINPTSLLLPLTQIKKLMIK